MAKANIKSKKGFTIIEVVLVLAIAGLIFLMVFVALPALQRSQRDTQRRQDYADLSSAISNYMTNNNGKLPPESSGKLKADQYINSTGKTPDGLDYTIKVVETNDASSNVKEIKPSSTSSDTVKRTVYVYTHANCDGSAAGTGYSMPKYDSSSRAYAIYGYLESGTYCQANK